jgi:outer membrane protein assembly factor BamB
MNVEIPVPPQPSLKRNLPFLGLALALWFGLSAPAPAQAEDWPQWGGVNRDGKSAETGLLPAWPPEGPKPAWKASGLGKGYSGVSRVGERLFTMGDKDEAGYIVTLNAANGQILWLAKVGSAGAPSVPGWDFPGPRCTPTVSGNLVFALDGWGELVCVSAADGQPKWRKNFTKDFGGKPPTWGYSESPLVDGDQVVVTPGGKNGAMVALDIKTGAVRWQSKEFTDDAHYSSIVPAQIGGARQYVQLTAAHVVGISAKDGALLWKAVRRGTVAVVPTPIVAGNEVYVTSGYAAGCNLFRIIETGGKFTAEQVYANHLMSNHHGGVIKVGDYLYGYCENKGFTCQNFNTGEVAWAEKEQTQKGSLCYADGMLYCREEENGTMLLVAASPSGYAEKGRFQQPDRAPEKAWPHPVISDGKLYLRDQDLLFCYELSRS